MVSVDSLVSQFLEVWPAFLVGVSAVYILQLYRRARLTDHPDTRGGVMRQVMFWLWMDRRRAFGAIASVFGVGIAVLKLMGWSILAAVNLDPIVLADLGAVLLSALHLSGIQLPLDIWMAVIGGLLVIGTIYGAVWTNEYFEDE